MTCPAGFFIGVSAGIALSQMGIYLHDWLFYAIFIPWLAVLGILNRGGKQ